MLFQFRLGRIPVQVHMSHVLIAGVFGWLLAAQPFSDATTWPGSALAAAPDAGPRLRVEVVLCWVGIIFVSVLFHEIGHALSHRAFGNEPSIQLVGMGGVTIARRTGPAVWWKDVVITLAGPVFGFVLGLVAYACRPLAKGPLVYILGALFTANLFWTVLNLMPVSPLDGGKISTTVLMRAFGRPGFLVAQILALVVTAGVIIWDLTTGGQIVAILFAWYGFAAIQSIAAYLRGDAPATAQSDPVAIELVQAAAAYREGKLDGARAAALAALEKNPTPPVRSRLHHLLGWIAIKEGHGRDALDHFAQVQGVKVEPHALGAAFSLVGDDERALPLWEHAWRETHDATVLHEWAGALLRLGRVEEVRRLTGVDMSAAYGCAERVLFIRGEYDAAARMGEAALAIHASAERAYDTACAFARAGRHDDALRLLQRAASLGYRDASHAAHDEDLSSLRAHPEFQNWLARLVTEP